MQHHRQLDILQDVGQCPHARADDLIHRDVGVGDTPTSHQPQHVGVRPLQLMLKLGQADRHDIVPHGHLLLQFDQSNVMVVVLDIKFLVEDDPFNCPVDSLHLVPHIMKGQVDSDVLLGDRDDSLVSALGAQHVGSCQHPGVREQGPAAKPFVIGHPGHVLHHNQGLPGEEAGLCIPPTNDALDDPWQRTSRPAAHCGQKGQGSYRQHFGASSRLDIAPHSLH